MSFAFLFKAYNVFACSVVFMVGLRNILDLASLNNRKIMTLKTPAAVTICFIAPYTIVRS